MLLALIVRGRRKRPRDTYYISLKKAKEKSSKSSPPQLTDEEIKDMVEHSGETPRKKSKDSMDEDYDPAMAGHGFGGAEDEASKYVNRASHITCNCKICLHEKLLRWITVEILTDSTPVEPRSGRWQRGLRSGERLVREDGQGQEEEEAQSIPRRASIQRRR